MKTILSSGRHRYVARVSIFLVAVALIVGMASCGGDPVFRLTVDCTEGGSVTWPGEGTYSYYDGTQVSLVAESDPGWVFAGWTGDDVGTIHDIHDASTYITMEDDYEITANFARTIASVAAGGYHTVGLKPDGNVVAVGHPDYGELDVNDWEDISHIAAGGYHTVGVDSNGDVFAVGLDDYDQRTGVNAWTDIREVAAGYSHTVGLAYNGTVVAVGLNTSGSGQCNVSGWEDIARVAAGDEHTVGLCSNGTVVAVGLNTSGQCAVDDWTDIKQVSAGQYHTVGLKYDGSVVAAGPAYGEYGYHGQCDVTFWRDIKQVAAGSIHTVGIKKYLGNLITTGNNDEGQRSVGIMNDIVWIAAGYFHTVWVHEDGKVYACGLDDDGQCSGVEFWTLS